MCVCVCVCVCVCEREGLELLPGAAEAMLTYVCKYNHIHLYYSDKTPLQKHCVCICVCVCVCVCDCA